MREILFRGKVKYNGNYFMFGDWVEGSLIKKSSGVFIYVIDIDAFGNITREIEVEVIPETVGQFASVSSLFGAQIFEGDILISNNGKKIECIHISGGFRRKEIGFNYKYTPQYISQDDVDKFGLSIIGNIHDNPELAQS